LTDEEGKVEKTRQGTDVSKLGEGQWWWD
jgi:hypothetical protein